MIHCNLCNITIDYYYYYTKHCETVKHTTNKKLYIESKNFNSYRIKSENYIKNLLLLHEQKLNNLTNNHQKKKIIKLIDLTNNHEKSEIIELIDLTNNHQKLEIIKINDDVIKKNVEEKKNIYAFSTYVSETTNKKRIIEIEKIENTKNKIYTFSTYVSEKTNKKRKIENLY